MTTNTEDTGVSERGSYERDLLRQIDVIEWCKRRTLSATLLVGGNYFGMTPLVEIITLLKKLQNPGYTGLFMLLVCLMGLTL